MTATDFVPGAADLEGRAALLADRLSDGLKPLARVAYNYRWSWARDARLFADIDPHRWTLSAENPVRFLSDLWPSTQESVERDPAMLARIRSLVSEVQADLERDDRPRPGLEGPAVFMCAEFGFHSSLPIYSGGLGVLAGDILKEASDQALPMIGIGLFYRRGYFRQRIDSAGRQQEFWLTSDPKSLPMARVTGADGKPLLLSVQVLGAETYFKVWRVDVGRVPLLLLDTEVPENDPVQRWTTARLYEGIRAVRLAQYALLGIGGIRVLQALGIEPAVVHLNEGHPALGPLELVVQRVEDGMSLDDAIGAVRERVVFTTHTPVAAGNETYGRDEFLEAYGHLAHRLGVDDETFLSLFRVEPGNEGEAPGMTPLAVRLSRCRNAVSRLHGEVSRLIWQPMFPELHVDEVPITHVTNGSHVATFVSERMSDLLDRYLGDAWRRESADPATWEAVRAIPNAELWAARCAARRALVSYVRAKAQQDRLLRGEQLDYVRAVERCLDPDALTLGFARRLATYKRLHLLTLDLDRLRRLVSGERAVQLLLAGKAHPNDEQGQDTLQQVYSLKRESRETSERIVFVADYDFSVARQLVAGCDVWINLPRKPMEASGTSGIKATFNGVLQLSVLDGWWAEAYNGTNGWAIAGSEDMDDASSDARDAGRFYDLLEHEVIPLFHDRDELGVPHAWCEKVKEAMVTLAPAFSATRMLNDYAGRIYPR